MPCDWIRRTIRAIHPACVLVCAGLAMMACDGPTGVPLPLDTRPLIYMALDEPFGWTLHEARPFGGEPTVVDVGSRDGLFPSLSPDGRRLAFVSELDPGVFVANPDGSDALRVFAPGRVEHIRWSPDASKLVVDVDGEIIIVDVDGSNAHSITDAIEVPLSYPSWSPSDRIAAMGAGGIYTMAIDGSDLRVIVPSDEFNEARDPEWSRNGNRLAFAFGRHGASSIFTVNPNGGDRQRVTGPPPLDSPYTDLGPVWSPTGLYMAFQREGNCDCEGTYGIHVVRYDGSGMRNLTKGTWGGVRPTW